MSHAPQPSAVRHRDRTSELVLDTSLLPILIVTFFGEITPALVDPFNTWMDENIDRARAAGDYLALITDAAECERPGPEARQKFTDHPHDQKVLITSPCVITSPVVRGALTAVGWVMGERLGNVTSWPTLEAAFAEAVKTLTKHGVKIDQQRVVSYLRPSRMPASLVGS